VDAPEWDVVTTDDTYRARVSREAPTWVLCAELRGEGIFCDSRRSASPEWEGRQEVHDREKVLQEAREDWRGARRLKPGYWQGMHHLLVHTFALHATRQHRGDLAVVRARPASDFDRASGKALPSRSP
jgi:hypothetical protein